MKSEIDSETDDQDMILEQQRQAPRQSRIDYMLLDARSTNICRHSDIQPEGWLQWQTDHKPISTKILGFRVLRNEDKTPWQKPLYKTKNVGEDTMVKVVKSLQGWQQVGRSPRQKLAQNTAGTKNTSGTNEGIQTKIQTTNKKLQYNSHETRGKRK